MKLVKRFGRVGRRHTRTGPATDPGKRDAIQKIGRVEVFSNSPSRADFCVDLIALLHFVQKIRVMALSEIRFGVPSRSCLVEVGKTLWPSVEDTLRRGRDLQ